MRYIVKPAQESHQYAEHSSFVVKCVTAIIQNSLSSGKNRIHIHTNLKRGLPIENINKIAGPFVEAWAVEQYEEVAEQKENPYQLIQVQAGKRLDTFDMILQFKPTAPNTEPLSGKIDVKATAQDIAGSGRSPNITSYARIRSEYLNDPDYIFIILSLLHRVYSEYDATTGLTHGVMEITNYSVHDLKYLASGDIQYNPALGTGQIQLRNVHSASSQRRTTEEFLHLLDSRYIHSKGQTEWLKLARKFHWIEEIGDEP